MGKTELKRLSEEELIQLVLTLQDEIEALKLKFEKNQKPPTSSKNSSQPPSRDQKGNLPVHQRVTQSFRQPRLIQKDVSESVMDKLTKVKVAGIPEGFRELKFTINDVTLNYVVGPKNGLPLLLIPGQMESWQGYKCVLPELSKRFHIFVPDLRGHGKSTWTPGHYSYNICGNDLKCFIQEVIQQPTLVAGLSSGGVLAIWLAANASEDVLAIISEDPPIFSSIWPRIQEEKLMTRNFKLAVDILGKPGERDVEQYLSEVGILIEGKSELLKLPAFIIQSMFFLDRINRAVGPRALTTHHSYHSI